MSKLRSQLDSLKRSAVHSAHVASASVNRATQLQATHQDTRAELAQLRNSIHQLTRQMSQQPAKRDAAFASQQAAQNVARTAPLNAAELTNSIKTDLRSHLSAEVSRIRSEISEIANITNNASDTAVMDDINRIAAGIAELQNRKPVQREDLEGLIGNLNQMQGDIRLLGERPTPQFDEAAISSAIQQSYQEIAARLDGLGQDRSNGKIDELAEKLEAVRDSLQHANPGALVEIEGQLKSLGESVSAVAAQVGHSDAQVVESVLPEYFENMDRRLNEITRAIMAASDGPSREQQNAYERVEARLASLAKSVENMALDHAQARTEASPSDANASYLDTINSQFASLADKIASVENSINSIQSTYSATGNEPATHLIDAKLEEMSKTLERAVNSGDDSVNQLQVRISELSTRLDEALAIGEQVAKPEPDERVLEQLQALAQRVEQLDQLAVQPAQDHAAQLQSLEHQISEIGTQLGSGLMPDLSGIENRLSGIEAQVQQSQERAIEAAKDAAARLAANMETAGIDPATTQNLDEFSKDLKSLSAASMELKGHSLETFDAVRDSLSMILDRINGIELRLDAEVEQAANLSAVQPNVTSGMAGNPSDQAIQAAHEFANTLKNKGADQTVEPFGTPSIAPMQQDLHAGVQQVSAPSLDLQDAPTLESNLEPTYDSAATTPVEQPIDMPLEPGSGAPDINAAVSPQVDVAQAKMLPEVEDSASTSSGLGSFLSRKDKGAMGAGEYEEHTDPTDFIAAARRAAQAAARDAQAAEKVADEIKVDKPSKLGFLKQYLSNRKKPVIIAAAAILLAVVALPIAKQTLLGSSEPVVEQVVQTEDENEKKALNAAQSDASDEDAPQVRELNAGEQELEAADAIPNTRNIDLSQQSLSNSEMVDNNTSMKADGSQTIATTNEMMAVTNAPMPNEEVGGVALRQAAAAGDPKALYEVGRRYTTGINGQPDFDEAVKWYRLSAQSGFAPAQYHLGNFYEKGHGLSPDPQLAAQWYEKAAEGGNALAMHNLAVINAMGVLEGGANLPKAVQWFQKAAEHGVKDSQVNLGIVYTKGMGVEANLTTAYKWFAVAAKAGDKDAAQKRDSIADSMRPDQIEQARGEVELWRPAELNPGANNVVIPDEWKDPVITTASLTDAQLIQKAQSLLTKIGYKPGPADGLMGARTISAIKGFQKKVGLPEDGKVTAELVSILEKAI